MSLPLFAVDLGEEQQSAICRNRCWRLQTFGVVVRRSSSPLPSADRQNMLRDPPLVARYTRRRDHPVSRPVTGYFPFAGSVVNVDLSEVIDPERLRSSLHAEGNRVVRQVRS